MLSVGRRGKTLLEGHMLRKKKLIVNRVLKYVFALPHIPVYHINPKLVWLCLLTNHLNHWTLIEVYPLYYSPCSWLCPFSRGTPAQGPFDASAWWRCQLPIDKLWQQAYLQQRAMRPQIFAGFNLNRSCRVPSVQVLNASRPGSSCETSGAGSFSFPTVISLYFCSW